MQSSSSEKASESLPIQTGYAFPGDVLPNPLPDETLHSVLSRYHLLSCNYSDAQTLNAIFGMKVAVLPPLTRGSTPFPRTVLRDLWTSPGAVDTPTL